MYKKYVESTIVYFFNLLLESLYKKSPTVVRENEEVGNIKQSTRY